MNQVRIGVVGIGNMGTSHCHSLAEGCVANAELVAVCDVKPERLAWAKETFKDIKSYDSIEGLIESGSCDALIIATPHYDHPTMGIQTLEAGLHVLVEKPIGVYTKAVEALNAVAMASDKVFAIMYNQRTNPLYQKVRKMVQDGELGELMRVNWVITSWYRTERYFQSGGWRATWEGEGGGVLLNQCPHQIDLIQWLCGMPSRVRGFAKYGQYHDIEVEDDVTAYFEYENGATGTFITSTGESPGTNRLEISGENGKIVVEDNQLIFYQNNQSMYAFSKSSDESFARPDCVKREIPVTGEETGHIGIMEGFVESILEDKKLLAPGVEGINGLTLSNAIHLSSWTDAWIDLPVHEDQFYSLLQDKIKHSRFVKVTNEQVSDVRGSH